MVQLLLDFTEATRRKQHGQSAALAKARGLFPKSNAAWGALTGAMARDKTIVWTGRFVNAEAKLTHCHPVRTWVLG